MKRVLGAVLVLLCAVTTGSCRSPGPEPTTPGAEPPPRFSFEDTAALLEDRDIYLSALAEDRRVLPRDRFEEILRRRMREHPSWEVLSVHLAEVDMPNPHFKIYDQATYVVEVTGPSTGNCFDFHLATTGRYRGGACFYPTRSH